MKAKELRRRLEQEGFKAMSAKKHIKYKHPDGRWTVIGKGSGRLREKP